MAWEMLYWLFQLILRKRLQTIRAAASVSRVYEFKEKAMLSWALIFFIVAVIAAVFGFTGIATAAAWIAQTLFFIFIVLFAIFLIVGLLAGRSARPPV
jgi:uncharacterized membrane protein YtjA (UPF0391 family)